MLATWQFSLIFFLCECGEFVMDQFGEFDYELCQCNWYLFPVEMQRMIVIVIMRPPIIRGYAVTECTREAFKRVKFQTTVLKYLR